MTCDPAKCHGGPGSFPLENPLYRLLRRFRGRRRGRPGRPRPRRLPDDDREAALSGLAPRKDRERRHQVRPRLREHPLHRLVVLGFKLVHRALNSHPASRICVPRGLPPPRHFLFPDNSLVASRQRSQGNSELVEIVKRLPDIGLRHCAFDGYVLVHELRGAVDEPDRPENSRGRQILRERFRPQLRRQRGHAGRDTGLCNIVLSAADEDRPAIREILRAVLEREDRYLHRQFWPARRGPARFIDERRVDRAARHQRKDNRDNRNSQSSRATSHRISSHHLFILSISAVFGVPNGSPLCASSISPDVTIADSPRVVTAFTRPSSTTTAVWSPEANTASRAEANLKLRASVAITNSRGVGPAIPSTGGLPASKYRRPFSSVCRHSRDGPQSPTTAFESGPTRIPLPSQRVMCL